MNLMGFGLAGLSRQFLVYPSYCIWPRSLATVALNQSLHNGVWKYSTFKLGTID